MLTKENFQDTWGRQKPEPKRNGTDNMVVDSPMTDTYTTPNETVEVEMAGTETGLDEATSVESDEPSTPTALAYDLELNSYTWRRDRKLPIFPFQRRGIGAIKSKAWQNQQKHKREWPPGSGRKIDPQINWVPRNI